MKQVCIRCVVRLALCFRFGHCKSQILPPAADPQRSPKRGRITRKQVQPTGAASREQSRPCWSILEAAPHYPAPPSPSFIHTLLSMARPARALGDMGCSTSQGLGLQEAAVLANRAGGVLQLPRAQARYRQWQPGLLTHPCQRNPVSE